MHADYTEVYLIQWAAITIEVKLAYYLLSGTYIHFNFTHGIFGSAVKCVLKAIANIGSCSES